MFYRTYTSAAEETVEKEYLLAQYKTVPVSKYLELSDCSCMLQTPDGSMIRPALLFRITYCHPSPSCHKEYASDRKDWVAFSGTVWKANRVMTY